MTVGEIARIVGGRPDHLDPHVEVTGRAEFDSRRVRPGDLFLAFPGERADGNDYAQAAVDAGAVAVLSTRSVPTGSVVVSDPLAAISALATAASRRLAATVIGVTGSSGKTSTKDLLAQVLSGLGTTVAPPGSFNNELGYPYTVLLADAGTRFLVLETSARGIGHITHLTAIARPQLGIVLNVGHAHVGEFGSVQAIAQAKGELVEALPSQADGGAAILNADDPLVAAMAERTTAQVIRFGESEQADVRAVDLRVPESGRPEFLLSIAGQSAPVVLSVHGRHQVGNALAAAAAAWRLGMPVGEIGRALSAATASSRWRMEVTTTEDGITVVNDAYNANPESMLAGLAALMSMSHGRRSVAVLGQMAELGDASEAEHVRVGRAVADLGVARALIVGRAASGIRHGAEQAGMTDVEAVADVEAATERLRAILEPGDVVFVKASRSVGMERVAEAIVRAHVRPAAVALAEGVQ
ncbi:UDP-N-acetylmuramoyl-tripeptide--D-alanyl-D-alanine ligase [Jatrophihabitans telluris]|uniref:UDP-N-acetylmuramoyl-tripeptide--D-alanyl-D-alanine ligase n=2 Tax=Jatrophihabitans telluris TaxID=2038343 RepID=A0ABY4QVR2_9ACTN|nr:UDP-N-acetylmuramoyl-tripeptide--D-alanyl-D-alanine ligase [Jatrophihabitans telluris]UQX87192.1 UDP-N-acetylmuramoyl-tripeptide--D-alanyl-D-alanine ligase [Jatrophihabitans telluris]